MIRQFKNDKGVIQIIVVLALTALLGAAALTIDIGAAMAERMKLSNAVDAATLAGAMELPTDPSAAKSKAAEFITLNGVDVNDVEIIVGADNRSLTINAAEPFQYILAIVGFASFFIEEVDRHAGQTDVTGRFVQFTSNGDIDEDAPDLGFYGMKLTTP